MILVLVLNEANQFPITESSVYTDPALEILGMTDKFFLKDRDLRAYDTVTGGNDVANVNASH